MGLDDVSQALHEGGLHLVRAGVAVLRHRASVAADLTPTEAKLKDIEGGGWGLETDELAHEFRKQESGGPKAAPSSTKHFS